MKRFMCAVVAVLVAMSVSHAEAGYSPTRAEAARPAAMKTASSDYKSARGSSTKSGKSKSAGKSHSNSGAKPSKSASRSK